MMKIKSHSQSYLFFVNLNSGERHEHIWNLILDGQWKNIRPENIEYNNLKGLLQRNAWKPVVGDILPVYPGMIWTEGTKILTDPTYVPGKRLPTMDTFLNAAESFFQKYQGRQIGVQLSGGLDSSIIIGLLKHLHIPFKLIGMSSKRYEFRTERYVQQKLQELTDDSILLDYEQHLPMSDFCKVPPYEYPDLLALNFGPDNAMAKECNKIGIEVLLTGEGGDNVFAEPISFNYNECTWLPQIFNNHWLAEVVYSPYGVDQVPFYADPGIMDAIYNLRLGQKEDNSKLWARNFFRDFLPAELINFTYCADFWGLYIDGLSQAIPVITELFSDAYDLTGHPYYSDTAIKDLLGQDLLHAKKEIYQAIEARTALALWLNTLKKNGALGL